MDSVQFNSKYLSEFKLALENVQADENGKICGYASGIQKGTELISQIQIQNKKIIMLGNGGSAGITSHMAVDYWKNGNIRATAFNDASLITCISNDFSYSEVFSKPVEAFADKNDCVFCISSSGKSENILNAARQAVQSGCSLVTFSGFSPENPLRKLGLINFYVPSFSYGFVEIIHNLIIHQILDAKLFLKDKLNIFNKNQPL